MRERVTDDFRLLVDFLGHEMAVIAFVEQKNRSLRLEHRALNEAATRVADLGVGATDHDAIAVFEVAHHLGKRRKRDGVRADEHHVVAEANR